MMRCVAVIPQQHVIEKILGHLRLPITPIPVSGPHTLGFDVPAYEVTDEAIADWFEQVDPEPMQRGPPSQWDAVDALGPDG